MNQLLIYGVCAVGAVGCIGVSVLLLAVLFEMASRFGGRKEETK
ncbi:hypothetical protein [Streptomyces sp. CB03911]|nr:hypothetical protein [Streptomyces sp. CB03911]